MHKVFPQAAIRAAVLLVLGRTLLVLTGFLVALLAMEGGWRAFYLVKRLSAGSWEEELKRTQYASPQTLSGRVTVGQLIEASPFPEVVYQLKPCLSGIFQGRAFQFNSYGMRDREYPLEKPAHTYRIVGLGDSIMFGWGVEQDKTYLKLVEHELNFHAQSKAEEQKYEVLNFGVPGYNTAMQVALFEKRAIRFNPDLVLIHFVNNDFAVPLFMERPRSPFTLRRSYLYEFIKRRLRPPRLDGYSDVLTDNLHWLDPAEKGEVLEQYRYMTGEKGYRKAMARLAELTLARGIKVLVLVSSSSKAQRKVIRQVCRRWGFQLGFLKPYVDEFVRLHNIENTASARRQALLISKSDPHPNELGHQIYKEAVLGELRRMGIP